MDYIVLRKKVTDAGLLDRQYGYYAFKIFYTMAAFGIFAFLLFTVSNLWLQLFLLVSLAFTTLQFGLLGHDAGHKAMFKSDFWNDAFGHLFMGFFGGFGHSYWQNKHNSHHANPNDEDEDPDFGVGLALTEEAMARKRGLNRLIAKHQHFLVIAIISTYFFLMHGAGIMHNIRQKNSASKLVGSLSMIAHIAVIWVAPFFLLPAWKALLFVLMYRLLIGFYFGSIVATNHKGMRVIKKGEQLGFVEKQILTTRNVRNGLLVDFVYGGLNNQIEHHLFPTMPRNNFRKVKPLVMEFCKSNNLQYEETGVIRSYQLILGELRRIALSAKKNKSPAPAANQLLSRSAN